MWRRLPSGTGFKATGIVALFLALTSCTNPSFTYVRNTTARTAFKVPYNWTVFDKQTFLGLQTGPTTSAPDPIQWLVAFDGSPTPSVNHILNSTDLATDYPQGIALVFSLSFQNRDTINFQTLRNFLFPVDYFQSDDIQFFAYNDNLLLAHNEVRGLEMDFEFRSAALPGAEQALAASSASGPASVSRPLPIGAGTTAFSEGFVRVDQIAYLDAKTNKLYLFLVACSAECYARNEGAIRTAVDSWTVLPS